jgi:hypothetical protein
MGSDYEMLPPPIRCARWDWPIVGINYCSLEQPMMANIEDKIPLWGRGQPRTRRSMPS